MRNNFNLDDFEAFLQESADQHRMYPSDRVWRNIHHKIHGEKRWPALTFASFVIGSIILAGFILVHPDKDLLTIPEIRASHNNQGFQRSSSEPAAKPDLNSQIAITNPFVRSVQPSIGISITPDMADGVETGATEETIVSETVAGTGLELPGEKSSTVHAEQPMAEANPTLQNGRALSLPALSLINAQEADTPLPEKAQEMVATVPFELQSTAFMLTSPSANASETQKTQDAPFGQKAARIKESVLPSKWQIEFFATPSLSYRLLLEDKLYQPDPNNTGPLAPFVTNSVNEFVNHKPNLGIEAGTSVVYTVNSDLRIKAGIQANMRQYTIMGYATKGAELASVIPGTYNISRLRAQSTTSANQVSGELNNRYWQIGIPIGFDLKMADWKKTKLYVAGSIQPTYQLNTSQYLLTYDFKSYVQQPDLISKFNVNTAVEAFVSFQSGGLNWQIGPQIRYQMLPGTTTRYPIREHLIDYGMKIGVVKPLR
jgi:hypothetical protein